MLRLSATRTNGRPYHDTSLCKYEPARRFAWMQTSQTQKVLPRTVRQGMGSQ